MNKTNIWMISFKEMSLKGEMILQQQSATTYAKAIKQVMWLKENSNISNELKKNRVLIIISLQKIKNEKNTLSDIYNYTI